MKMKLLLASACALFAFTSCIKDEALNAECDITGVDSLWLQSHRDILIGNPIVANERVSFNVAKGTDITALDPRFYLTPGARLMAIGPDGQEVEANGMVRDFTTPKNYTTYSEDGLWHKNYVVSFDTLMIKSNYNFEHYQLESRGRFYNWFEVDENDATQTQHMYWATGNPGYALTGKGTSPDVYPTQPIEGGGPDGSSCIKLTTCSTGSFGENLPDPMPIAAGNIFLGEFRVAYATMRPRNATRFGLQLVGGEPISLEGYYKYTAGETFINEHKEVLADRHDTADIYAVVYEVDPANFVPLNGDEVLTSDRIVYMSRIDDPGEPQEWTYFNEPFRLMPGKTFDPERVKTNGYAIALVATSSREGAYFRGAIGSTLYVDQLKISWK